MGHCLPHPSQLVSLVEESFTEDPDATPVDVKPLKLPDDRTVDLDLAHLSPEWRQKVLDMLKPHADMWDGRLGTVSATQRRIELTPGAKPVFCQPYRAGPRARDVELSEVTRMLKAGVIEPAAAE